MIIPQEAIGIGGKPSGAQSRSAIGAAEACLDSDETEKLRAVDDEASIIAELPRVGSRVEGAESVFGLSASENGERSRAAEDRDGEDRSGEADHKAEDRENDDWQGNGGNGGFGGLQGFGGIRM